jgi:hypothetical protein
MRLKILTSVAAIALLTAFTPFSASEKDLVGTWKVDASSVASTVKKVIDKAVEANPAAEDQINEQKDKIVEMVQGIRLIMKADHTYESITPQGTKPGKWVLANKDRVIVFTKEDGTIRRDSILESTVSRMKLINGQLKDTIVYVHP